MNEQCIQRMNRVLEQFQQVCIELKCVSVVANKGKQVN